MVINDHPTGSKSGPREKQTQSHSLRANVTAARNMPELWRGELRCFLLWLEDGDRMP